MFVPPAGRLYRVYDPLLRCELLPLASQHAFLDLPLAVVFHFFFPFVGDVEHLEGVGDEALFNVAVEGRVGSEAGCVVDLNEVGGELVVQHHVKPQHLKAHIVGEVVGVHQGHAVTQRGVPSYYCLYQYVVDALLEGGNIVAIFLNTPVD